jgi:hypothetical protein
MSSSSAPPPASPLSFAKPARCRPGRCPGSPSLHRTLLDVATTHRATRQLLLSPSLRHKRDKVFSAFPRTLPLPLCRRCPRGVGPCMARTVKGFSVTRSGTVQRGWAKWRMSIPSLCLYPNLRHLRVTTKANPSHRLLPVPPARPAGVTSLASLRHLTRVQLSNIGPLAVLDLKSLCSPPTLASFEAQRTVFGLTGRGGPAEEHLCVCVCSCM